MKKMKRLVSLVLALAMVMTMVLGMGVTASAETNYTITIENSVTGKEYTAYKIFDVTYSDDSVAYYITENSEWYTDVTASGSPFTVSTTTDSEGRYYVTESNGADTITAWIVNHLSGKTVAVNGTGNGGSLTLDVGSPGYYYVTTTNGTKTILTTANPTGTAYDKESTPGDVKKTADETTVQIGDEVTYTIEASVARYSGSTEITEFTFKDELSAGLIAPTADKITVKILDASGNVWAYLSGSNYADYISVNTSTNTITITFNPTTLTKADTAATGDTLSGETDYPTFATIYISYTATVDADAAYANSNTVTETWTGDSTGSTDKETVYTYGFNLWKVIENTTPDYTYATGDLLDGAEFTLTETNSTTPIGFIKSEDNGGNVTYTVSTDNDNTNYTTTITVGSALIFGLDAGTYTLTETKAPDGYNLLTSTVSVTVGEDGKYSDLTGINTNTTIVENSAGTALPGTGGIGTTIFYIIGGILVAGAAVLLITRRRMRRV